MQKSQITYPLFVNKFPKHKEYKQQLLDLIAQQPSVQNKDYGKNDSNINDWYIDKSVPRKYADLICMDLIETLEEMLVSMGVLQFEISEIWFQQYYKNDTHAWHRHDGAQMANVYYVELPIDAPPTTIINPFDNSIIVPEVTEGDILSFPGSVLHSSPKNHSNQRKTIIAFNIEFKDQILPLD